MWTCPRCGSSVDPSYPSCWSCGTLQEGTADPIVARADEPHTGEWVCPKCGETVDAAFEVCWSCGTSRDGVEDPTFERADEAEVAADVQRGIGAELGDAAQRNVLRPAITGARGKALAAQAVGGGGEIAAHGDMAPVHVPGR